MNLNHTWPACMLQNLTDFWVPIFGSRSQVLQVQMFKDQPACANPKTYICYDLTIAQHFQLSQTIPPVPSTHCTWWWTPSSGSWSLGFCVPSRSKLPAGPSSEPQITPATCSGRGVNFLKVPMQRGSCYITLIMICDRQISLSTRFLFCCQLFMDIYGWSEFPKLRPWTNFWI